MALSDKIAGERVEEFTVDTSIEAIPEAAERIDEEADEAIIDKIAGGEAVLDNTAGAVVTISDKVARGEAARDKTAEEGKAILEATERVDEYIVEPPIEAVLVAAERIDEEVEGPRIESSPQ